MTNILAFDQSSTHVGYAVSNGTSLVYHGELKPDPPDYDHLRLWVKDVIKEYAIDVVVVEGIYLQFYTKNNGQMTAQAQVFKVLATVRAHIWAASRDEKCDVVEISAYAAMKALTGITDIHTKSADRKAAMIKSATEFTGVEMGEHESDALGLLLAYLQTPQP